MVGETARYCSIYRSNFQMFSTLIGLREVLVLRYSAKMLNIISKKNSLQLECKSLLHFRMVITLVVHRCQYFSTIFVIFYLYYCCYYHRLLTWMSRFDVQLGDSSPPAESPKVRKSPVFP